jgi:hypothetical protein
VGSPLAAKPDVRAAKSDDPSTSLPFSASGVSGACRDLSLARTLVFGFYFYFISIYFVYRPA